MKTILYWSAVTTTRPSLTLPTLPPTHQLQRRRCASRHPVLLQDQSTRAFERVCLQCSCFCNHACCQYFATIPASPYRPTIVTNLFLVGGTTTFSWSANYADSYSVYLGTSAITWSRSRISRLQLPVIHLHPWILILNTSGVSMPLTEMALPPGRYGISRLPTSRLR
jgi:hypothetical protein